MKQLTPRQKEMIELLSLGLSQKEIADHLQISVNTVDALIRQAKERLNLQKNTELVAWYYIHRYHLTLNLSPVKKALIAASLLSLSIYSIVLENKNMLRVMKPVRCRIARTGRSRSGREGKDGEDIFYFEDYLNKAS